MEFTDRTEKLLAEIRTVLEGMNGTDINNVVKSILDAKIIFTYGVGRSALVAKAFSIRLVQMGLKAHFIGESTTPIVTKDDVLVVVSNTGETYSAIQTARVSKSLGVKIIVITSSQYSKLGQLGNYVVILPSNATKDFGDIAPLGTLFEASALILFDALISQLMKELGESDASMRERHAIWV